MPRRDRSSSSTPTIDAHVDPILMRYIRLLKPELARTGFRTARWGDVAAATNQELGVKKFKTGRSAQRRFGILRSVYEDEERRESLPTRLTRRMDEYFAMMEARQASAAEAEEANARHQANDSDDDEDDGHEDHEDDDAHTANHEPDDEAEEEEEEDRVEEVELKREVRVEAAMDLTEGAVNRFGAPPPGYAFAMPRSRESILYEQVQTQQTMMQSLLDVIKNDRAAHRQQFREVLRLAARK